MQTDELPQDLCLDVVSTEGDHHFRLEVESCPSTSRRVQLLLLDGVDAAIAQMTPDEARRIATLLVFHAARLDGKS